MNKEIVVGFFKEHGRECRYEAISQHIKQKRNCTFCLDINRDISLLITRVEGARKTVDVGLALGPDADITHYLPYERAGFKLFHQRGTTESEHILSVLRDIFAQGYEKVVVLSHSTPNLPVAYLERAIGAMRRGMDLVVGPLENGMFYLVGLTGRTFDRLQNLPVVHKLGFLDGLSCDRSVKAFKDVALDPLVLPKWYIVKTLEDLKKVYEDTSSGKGNKARWIGGTISELHEHIH